MKYVVTIEKWADIEIEAESVNEARSIAFDMEAEGCVEFDMTLEAQPAIDTQTNKLYTS